MAGREGPRPASYFFRAPARVRQQKSLCEADPKTPKALDENAGRRAQPKLRRGCELNVVRFRALTARTQRELNVSITRRCHQKPDKGDTESLEYEDLCAPARGGEGAGESLILFYSTIRYRHQGRHQGRHPVPEPVGTWGKMESRERNEFVCCVSRDGARRGSSFTRFFTAARRETIDTCTCRPDTGQKFYMSVT